MRLLLTATFTGLALAMLAPAAHAAPAVTLDRPCYAPGDPIIETGSGFVPGTTIAETLSLASNDPPGIVASFTAPPAVADAAGAFTRGLEAPDLGRRTDRQETAVSAFTDQAAPDSPTVVQWTLTGWDAELGIENGRISRRGRMRVDTWGWTIGGTTLYAHYFRAGKRAKTVTIGALVAPCGDLEAVIRQFPFKAKPGVWRMYLSATPRLDREVDAWISFRLKLKAARPSRRTAAIARSLGPTVRHPRAVRTAAASGR